MLTGTWMMRATKFHPVFLKILCAMLIGICVGGNGVGGMRLRPVDYTLGCIERAAKPELFGFFASNMPPGGQSDFTPDTQPAVAGGGKFYWSQMADIYVLNIDISIHVGPPRLPAPARIATTYS